MLPKISLLDELRRGGYEASLSNLERHRIPIYATFLFGYDRDTSETFARTLRFAKRHAFYLTAFNHVTPFPGTPLYSRLEKEGRLLYDRWWLDEEYSYNKIPFRPMRLSPEELHQSCLRARRSFYSPTSVIRRAFGPANRADLVMFSAFFPINLLHTLEVEKRDH